MTTETALAQLDQQARRALSIASPEVAASRPLGDDVVASALKQWLTNGRMPR